ncbi:MAG: RIP metalloprotease RseP [Candidatus Falkowbacteria bacterium]|nr:RIP metalloprotease RseP [Candidatus Falkowbacteria bacterium]
MFLTIIVFLVMLSLLVFVHEFGHFWTARKLGVKAEEFGFGFPPRFWGIYKTKDNRWKQIWGNKEITDASDTVYSVNCIPLGGFVKIKGENGDSNDPDSFSKKSIRSRMAILSAGVTMNFLLTAVLLSIGFMLGLPQVVDSDISKYAQVSKQRIQITEVLKDTAASNGGLKIGDIITSINGTSFENITDMQAYVAKNVKKELSYSIKRGNDNLIFALKPQILKETKEPGVGVGVSKTGMVSYPFFIAIWHGFSSAVLLIVSIIIAFFNLFKGLLLGSGVSASVAGPVGIASLTGDMARLGFVYILQFTALLSANLAVVNFLPIPALDGGRVLFLLIEKIKGSPVKRELEATIHYVGFALLMILVVLVTFRDIANF